MSMELRDIDSELKSEGFEDNAAVRIGKREQTPEESLARAKDLENEGNTQDLATYLRLNKVVVVPFSFIAKNEKNLHLDPRDLMPGRYFGGVDTYMKNEFIIVYLDKDRNICRTHINSSKIADLRLLALEAHNPALQGQLEGEIRQILKKLGFQEITGGEIGTISQIERLYLEDIEEQKKEKGSGEFDF